MPIPLPLLLLAAIYLLAFFPLWYLAKKKNRFHPVDFAYPVLPILFWIALAETMPTTILTAGKSLANLIELLIVGLLSLIVYRLKILKIAPFSPKKAAWLGLAALLLLTLLLFLLTPPLPE